VNLWGTSQWNFELESPRYVTSLFGFQFAPNNEHYQLNVNGCEEFDNSDNCTVNDTLLYDFGLGSWASGQSSGWLRFERASDCSTGNCFERSWFPVALDDESGLMFIIETDYTLSEGIKYDNGVGTRLNVYSKETLPTSITRE